MKLEDIYENSNYISDEEATEAQTVLIANQCFSYVNSHVGTNLPFFTDENYSAEDYIAVKAHWVYRLVEPYLTWAIVENDGVDHAQYDFHYQRFLMALSDFAKNGIKDILTEIDDGSGNMVPTGHEGNAKRSGRIVHNGTYTNPWAGRWS